MARFNNVLLTGYVTMSEVHTNAQGESFALAYVTVARPDRNVGDGKDHMKCDCPVVMTRDPELIRKMSEWKQYDIVQIKGVVACKRVTKVSFCPKCNNANRPEGVLVFVNPIHLMKFNPFDKKPGEENTQEECLQFLAQNREISNSFIASGTLCTDPKTKILKSGVFVSQYQIALRRSWRDPFAPPEERTDFPWIKSYGELAESDADYLQKGAEVIIDGCLQARRVQRHTICPNCGTKYDWVDNALEGVPFSTEYVAGHKTQEEIEAAKLKEKTDKLRGLADLLASTASGNKEPDDDFTD